MSSSSICAPWILLEETLLEVGLEKRLWCLSPPAGEKRYMQHERQGRVNREIMSECRDAFNRKQDADVLCSSTLNIHINIQQSSTNMQFINYYCKRLYDRRFIFPEGDHPRHRVL